MADLRALAESLDFTRVRTHLASGNLLVDSPLSADAVRDMCADAHWLAPQRSRPLGQ
jgi:uncharacterized protein (DUF1697 family)